MSPVRTMTILSGLDEDALILFLLRNAPVFTRRWMYEMEEGIRSGDWTCREWQRLTNELEANLWVT